MIVFTPYEQFPSYEFFYESYYNELEEYAYINKDVFGDDPDWNEVLRHLISEKDDAFIEPFSDKLAYFNRELEFFEIPLYAGTGWPVEYDYMITVTWNHHATREYDADPAYRNQKISAEAELIRGWLDRYPEMYGFRKVIPSDKGKTPNLYLNLRPAKPTEKKWGRFGRS